MDDNGAATQPTQMAATQIASQPDAADDANVWGCLLPCNSLNTYVFRINLQNAKCEYTVGRSTANDIPFVKAMTVSEFPSLCEVALSEPQLNQLPRFKALQDRVGRRHFHQIRGQSH